MEKVAIVKCSSYKQEEVDAAIKRALNLLKFDTTKYKKILIKPGVLGGFVENQEAITTHPYLIKSLTKEFKGEKIIGESSSSNTKQSLEKAGYSNFNNLLVFETSKLVKIQDKKAKVLKSFYLSETVKNVNLIINVPKLKTHLLTKFTGAIKNLYGCIPGGLKHNYHKKAIGGEKFSSLLIDIYQNIKPGLNIMDAIITMEGEGPSSGDPKKVGLILASRNAIALDIAASKLIGYFPKEVFFIKEAIKRKLYPDFKIKVVGDLKEIPNLKFKKPLLEKSRVLRGVLIRLVRKNPIIVDKKECIRCGECAKKCPANAIILKQYPIINKKRCIRCFCCVEVCPKHATHLKETFERKIYRRLRKVYSIG